VRAGSAHRSVYGWEPPKDADLQSYLGMLLRTQVDPLPPFVSQMWQVDGKPIAVIRIFPTCKPARIRDMSWRRAGTEALRVEHGGLKPATLCAA
jgi:hypothetical protein